MDRKKFSTASSIKWLAIGRSLAHFETKFEYEVNAKPQLLCWMMCDGVHIDPSTGKHYIMGTFSNIRVRKFPARHPRMVWFLTLSDVSVGQHFLKISLGIPTEAPKVIVQRPFESKSPIHRINLINDIQNLGFEKPGDYSVVIEIDDDPLTVTSLTVSN